jgi:RNA polymerase sigma-70 factor (ECF subfamily)
MQYSSQQLLNGIRQGDVAAFETLYRQYYVYLCLIAEHIVRNHCDAEEIVSDVFVKLWSIKEKTVIATSIKAYLIKAVHNTSINYIEKLKSENKLTDSLSNSDFELLAWDSDYPLGQLYTNEIMEILDQGINTLPERCRQIFLLSRNEDMKYCDIASKIGISVNSVKTQMKIALSRLHDILQDYLIILLLFMWI